VFKKRDARSFRKKRGTDSKMDLFEKYLDSLGIDKMIVLMEEDNLIFKPKKLKY
jgi:hypothetical protein